MATADYIKGGACGHEEMLSITLGWLMSTENTGGMFTKLQDFVDTGQMNNDGERNVILRADNPGELPIYIGLRGTAKPAVSRSPSGMWRTATSMKDARPSSWVPRTCATGW